MKVNTIRNVVAVILGILSLALIPIYGSPFGGCRETGFITLQLGCSDWPEFMRGFIFVILCSAISASRFWLPAIATIFVVIISIFGGFDAIRVGDYNEFKNISDVGDSFFGGLPVLYGGAFALFIYMIAKYFTKTNHGA